MTLTNFGSILDFAEQIENEHITTYNSIVDYSICSAHTGFFKELCAVCKKNIKEVQRTRRENVTEMILEPIKDFEKKPFYADKKDINTMTYKQVLQYTRDLEQRAEKYYITAAEKIKTLSEVSRILGRIAKKHTDNFKRLADKVRAVQELEY